MYSFITSKNPAAAGIEYEVLHCKVKLLYKMAEAQGYIAIYIYLQVKEWIKSFWKLGHICAGYKPCNVTPYMHIMVYHVPDLIRTYGNIKQYSCQGNDIDS